MTYTPPFSYEPPLSENISYPEKYNDFLILQTKVVRDHARKINDKDRGYYSDVEILNNQKFFDAANRNTVHNIYRKVIDCGALPNAATKQIAHGIVGIGNTWMFTRIYGTAIEPAGAAPRPFYIPLPNAGANYQVELMVDNTNVNITTIVNLSTFTQSYIILEFWKI